VLKQHTSERTARPAWKDGESVRVFAEGPEDSPSRQLRAVHPAPGPGYEPAQQVRLIARHALRRGGDHTAFNQHGYAAVRVTEATRTTRGSNGGDVVDAVSFRTC